MIFISPPFGNYIKLPGTMSIKGSYTLNERPGLVSQIVKTLRYVNYNGERRWINKIGLRNPGIVYGLQKYNPDRDIISVAIMDKKDINKLNEIIPNETNIEINISCPNAEKHMVNDGINVFLNDKRKWCIVKLSPTTDKSLIDSYYSQGFRQFHCSNTVPSPKGGISGNILIPYTSDLVRYIRTKSSDSTVIAGGGIYNTGTMEYYKRIGATHVSVSTIFFHPGKFIPFFYKYYTGN
jgi:dihydroorotate dehydrogenase